MLKLLKKKPCLVLGIDINSTSINILQLSNAQEKYCVEGYGRALLTGGVIQAGLIKDVDRVAACIRALCSSKNLLSKQAIVAVPSTCAINKIIQISANLHQQDIEEYVYCEAEKHIPYPLHEINLDFNILGPSPHNAAQLDVFIVASRTETINLRVEAVHRAGLDVQAVDVESYAIERAMHLSVDTLDVNGFEQIIAMFEINSDDMHCYVYNKVNIIFSREEVVVGVGLGDSLGNSTLSFFEALLLQIKRTLQFFSSIEPHLSVDLIVLAGTALLLPGFSKFVESHLHIRVHVANPFRDMAFATSQIQRDINIEHPMLMAVCGLALRGCGSTIYG